MYFWIFSVSLSFCSTLVLDLVTWTHLDVEELHLCTLTVLYRLLMLLSSGLRAEGVRLAGTCRSLRDDRI